MKRAWNWTIRQIHASWFIAAWALGVLIGTTNARSLTHGYFGGSEWLIMSLALLFIVFVRRIRLLLLVALLAGILTGLWRAAPHSLDRASYQAVIDSQVELSGRVARDVSEGSNSQNLQLADIKINDKSLSGRVWASTFSDAEIKRSDRVVLSGRLNKGFGNYAASMSFAELKQVKRAPYGDIGRDVRDDFAGKVRQHLPGSAASLGVGFLTGLRSGMPDSLFDNLRTLGLVHIVVASGYHLNIVAGTTRRRLAKVSKFLAVFVSFLIFGSFLLVTGFGTSMIRATLVGGMGLMAWYYGRLIHPFVLLPLAAAITVLMNPGFIWGDMGWYLSFAAFSGVIILAPLLNSYFFADKGEGGLMRKLLLATVAAQAFTLPIIAVSFEQYSVYSLIANLLIVPIVPLAMLFTFLTGLFSYFASWLAGIFSYPAKLLLEYVIVSSQKLADLPYAEGSLTLNTFSVVSYYSVLVIIMWYLKHHSGHDLRGENLSY